MDLESEALREAYAVAPANTVTLDTLEVSVTGETSIFLTNNYAAFTTTLETGASATFQRIPFKVNLPSKGKDELPVMRISIANPNQIVSNYLRAAKIAKKPVTIKFRPFITTDDGVTFTYQLPVPMTFNVGPVDYGIAQVSVQCLFPNIANKKFPNESYTVRLFPGLRGW